MFYDCDKITSIDVSSFYSVLVENIDSICLLLFFENNIHAPCHFVTINVTSSTNMFMNSLKIIVGVGINILIAILTRVVLVSSRIVTNENKPRWLQTSVVLLSDIATGVCILAKKRAVVVLTIAQVSQSIARTVCWLFHVQK
ncbi:MAG: hypothetical protein HUJ51_02240 [Eggerthellaceae bacterium]|nr:hypothetical protein [Eggerthellaceae bacterium]